jgi:hypothetical protein
MALDITKLQHNGYLRPPHFDDAIAVFNGESENSYTAVSLTTAKAALKTAIQTLINATSLSGGEKTGLYNDCSTAIDAQISNSYTINKTDVFTEAKTQLKTAISADSTNFGYIDNRCGGTGRYPTNRDTGTDDTTDKACPSCDQFGGTATANTPQSISWTVNTTF